MKLTPLQRLAFPALLLSASLLRAAAAWVPDQGDGTYRNPVLFADYSDPDAVRVGADFYLVSSSFHCTPGLPILHSKDLVNWQLIGHALPAQVPAEHFSVVRHGEGVWAPSIRYHAGKFWTYYPDPDFGIYCVTATDPAGAWSAPVLVLSGKGLIDPCPLWDDDGQAYLVHGWAKSRSGVNNRLTVSRLSPDGMKSIDEDRIVVDGDKIPGLITLEGPKFYKRHGFYYIFAPAGGVAQGYQLVFRAKDIYGPYERRIVLDQGRTAINGPHQGAWVDTAGGQDWFLHFQDRGAFGRVVHLEPMAWRSDDWPVIGSDPGHTGKGEPVLTFRKPDVGRSYPVAVPQTSDEFDAPVLGLQWQWQANPRPEWASLSARPGSLRLYGISESPEQSGGNWLYHAPNLLLQKFPAPGFTVTTEITAARLETGDCAGLAVIGYDCAWIGLQALTGDGPRLAYGSFGDPRRPVNSGTMRFSPERVRFPLYLRVSVDARALCHFSYSFDGASFQEFGSPLQASIDRWIGAKVGLFGVRPVSPVSGPPRGWADFDWFRVTP